MEWGISIFVAQNLWWMILKLVLVGLLLVSVVQCDRTLAQDSRSEVRN